MLAAFVIGGAARAARRLIEPGLVPAASMQQVEALAGDRDAGRPRWLREIAQ